jgi:methyl-accepting chemotaxis protein
MLQSPAPTTPNTRQKTTLKKSRKDLEEADGLNTAICSKEQAIAYLTAGDYITPGKPIDLHILSHILLQFSISNKLPKPVTDGIRAVAFLMEDTHTQQIADSIADAVKVQLSNHIESFVTNIENIRDVVEHVTNATKSITGKMDELNEGFQETAEHLAQATQELSEKTTETTNKVLGAESTTPVTYAVAVQQQSHLDCATIINKGNITAKQILI